MKRTEEVILIMRWKTFFFDSIECKYELKSSKYSPPIPELDAFEKDLFVFVK